MKDEGDSGSGPDTPPSGKGQPGASSGLGRSSRSGARRLNAWSKAGILFLILVAVSAAYQRWAPGPRYQGKPVGYWFPRLVWENQAIETAMNERMETLASAGPEVMPLLVAAAKVQDGSVSGLFGSLRNRLPGWARRLAPVWVQDDWVRSWVAGLVCKLIERDDVLRAYTNAFAAFPEEVNWDVARAGFPQRPGVRDIVLPFLRRLLREGNAGIKSVAAMELLDWAATEPDLLPEVATACAQWPPGFVDQSFHAQMLVRRLGTLGTDGVPFVPWLAGWLEDGEPLERAFAAIALPAIAPERFPWQATVAAQLPRIGLLELELALPTPREFTNAPSAVRAGILRALAPLLDPDDPVSRAMPPKRGPVASNRNVTNAVSLVLQRVAIAGPEAVAVTPQLAQLLRHPEPTWSGVAAETLARLGPVAPETLPNVMAGLSNGVATPALVLLLATYGPAARPALPALRAFVDGPPPEGVDELKERQGGWSFMANTNRRPMVHPSLAARTGRTNEWPLPEALRAGPSLDWYAGPGELEIRMSAELMRRYGLIPKGVSLPAMTNTPVPSIALADLAREAILRIEASPPQRP